ncbi:MAG: hypothetical protein HYS87_02880 [Candidatus Colwellbacteria bacterium]|nr:hypothetical protein [Candidatus Colwellbacteria bacterium]
MLLKGIDFGPICGASGVQGFFGEGYWYHRVLKPVGLDFRGMTFVAKTTTLNPRKGNMPLRRNFTPCEILPESIVVRPLKGIALNAVGLSGPGAKALFEQQLWQRRKEPFFISFMSVAENPTLRIEELAAFVELFHKYLPHFKAPVGLQINYSCPNVGLHMEELVHEVKSGLDIAFSLKIPVVPKFNLMLPAETAADIAEHRACDALCISNTIPWGQFPDRIDWNTLFPGGKSPLERFGGGGLSGKPLLPLLLEWLIAARESGLKKQINAGGGILSLRDAERVFQAGADSVFLGSIAFLRPWRIRKIISGINSQRA